MSLKTEIEKPEYSASSMPSAHETPAAQATNAKLQVRALSATLIVLVIIALIVIAFLAYFILKPQTATSTSLTTIAIPSALNLSLTHAMNGTTSLISSLWLGLYKSHAFSVSQFAVALAGPGISQPNMNATFAFSSSSSSSSTPINLTIRLERIGKDYRVDMIQLIPENNTELAWWDSISFVNGIYNFTIWNLTHVNEQPTQRFASKSANSIAQFFPQQSTEFNISFQAADMYNSSFDGIGCQDITGNVFIISITGGNPTAYGKFNECISYKYNIPLNLSINASTNNGSYVKLSLKLMSINNNPSQSYIDSVPG